MNSVILERLGGLPWPLFVLLDKHDSTKKKKIKKKIKKFVGRLWKRIDSRARLLNNSKMIAKGFENILDGLPGPLFVLHVEHYFRKVFVRR